MESEVMLYIYTLYIYILGYITKSGVPTNSKARSKPDGLSVNQI